MVNNLLLLIDLVGLLLMDVFLVADLRITQDIPANMAAGSEVKVVVNVQKGELAGFAKLQLDLPDGFSVSAIETKGASFTFADQKAKFIWMALPSTPTFRISYTLRVDAGASGTHEVTGRLSYIEDNERKTFELPSSTVSVTPGGEQPSSVTSSASSDDVPNDVVALVEERTVEEEAILGDELVSAAGGAPLKGLMVAVVEQASGVAAIQGAGGVTGTRKITPVNEQEMIVEVTVNKGSIRGFGKLQETVPQGFVAMEKSSDEAIFTAQDRVVKFVWLNLPARNTITVTYKLRAEQRPDGEYSIDGEFGYLLNDETQKAVLGTSRFFVGPKALETLTADDASMSEFDQQDSELALRERERQEAEQRAREEAEREVAQARDAASREEAPKPSTPPTPRIPAPEKGVTYKVQIMAAHREVGRSYFQARHRYSGEFSIERHQGWIKYVTGSFATYKDARDRRVDLVQAGHDFPGPFVTAYNNGERISVQEALMLTSQQWVQ